MYVIGGNSSGGLLNNVQYAPINGGGDLGSWSNTSSFTTARYWHASTIHNGYVYLLGGSNGDYTNNLGDVQYAPINGGGTLGAWAATTGLPTVRIGHTVIASGNYMYSISGFTNGTGYLTEVLYSLIDGSGTLGIWQYTSNVSVPGAGLRADIKDGYVYLTGGFAYYDQGYYFNDVQYAPIFTTGGVGAWSVSENKLRTPRANHSSVVSGDYMYSLGGQTTGDGVVSSVEYAKLGLNNLGTAAIGNMSDTSRNINIGRHENRSVAYNGYLYSLGGKDAGLNYYADVQYATIDASGNIGAWSYTQSFNGAGRKAFTAHAYNGYMYVVGGEASPGNYLGTVQYAPINTNGTLGTWQSANSLNFARGYHGGAIYNGYIYATNGTIGGSVSSSIEYAAINNNGSLGAWNLTNNPTTPTNTHVSFVYNGYLYTVGGWTGTVHSSGYQYAKLNTNGSVGSWSEVSNAFPARAHHGAFAYNGYMYVIGGYGAPSWNALSDAYVAKINANGTTSAWSLAGSGVLNNQEFNITQYGNTVISVGGSANRANTYSATVSTIDQKARYSKLMNLGGVFNFERMTSSKTGNGEIRPSFKSGGSTRLTLATDQKCKPSTQYVLFTLEIDESNSMTLDGTPTSVQDVTLEYSSKYQTNQRLRGGAWFNNESLQPLDTCAP
jgi:Kelch motif